MPRSVKLRLAPFLLLAALAALFVVGCGGGDDGGSGDADPATIAPVKTPVFIDFMVRPDAETGKNIDALAEKIAGVDNVGELIIGELENSASEGDEEFDYEKEVEPWLGEKGGLFLQEYEDDDFEGYGAAIQTSDEDAARDFIFKQVEADEDEEVKDGSYEGVDFKVEEDETTFGVFDGLVAFAEDEATFKTMVDAANGENLAGEDTYTSTVADVPDGSAANVYVDIGALIEESGDEIDDETRLFLDGVGIEPDEATAVASLVPGSDQIEIDFSTNLSGENPPTGDASELLGSLPATSVGAFAAAEFGERFNESIDQIDKQGIPSEGIEPGELKKGLKQAGIDLESIAGSIGDVGAYVTGNSESTLGGALIMEAEDATQAKNTVSNIGLFLRSANVPGVTSIKGKASGFSIRDPELGRQPVVVAAKGSRIAIGYGLASTLSAFEEASKTLADLPAYKDAVSALGDTPITAFVDGPAALNLASALIPPGEEEFEAAEQYLEKIDYIAVGSEASGGLATAKLIVGVK
ncbi:MAG TPA: DUF3352 domain-containing protein [Solirubrobacterales bacterium]|nr:DUF3352 domain-containing protein [Solirubrobacterales bacterium]